jgi:hypothetical protein
MAPPSTIDRSTAGDLRESSPIRPQEFLSSSQSLGRRQAPFGPTGTCALKRLGRSIRQDGGSGLQPIELSGVEHDHGT